MGPLRSAAFKIKSLGSSEPMAGAAPHFLVFANEKGGTGKSTTAVHSAVALAAQGRRVAAIDLDTRQRTLGRYLDNRSETVKRLGIDLVMPAYETFDPDKPETVEKRLRVYHEQTEPIVKHYDDQGILKRFDGTRPPTEVHDHLRATIATLRLEDEI